MFYPVAHSLEDTGACVGRDFRFTEESTAVASTIANGIEYLPYAGVVIAAETVPVTLIGQTIDPGLISNYII